MAKTKIQKKQLIEKYEDLILRSKAIYFAKAQLNVNETTSLKKDLNKSASKVTVIKNTIFQIAFEKVLKTKLDLNGQKTVIFCINDVVDPAKVLLSLIKEEKAEINLCVYNGQLVDISKFTSISNLEPLDVLQAKLAYVLNEPVSSFARVLNQNIAKLCYALNSIKEKNKI